MREDIEMWKLMLTVLVLFACLCTAIGFLTICHQFGIHSSGGISVQR